MPSAATNAAFARMVASFDEPTVTPARTIIKKPVKDTSAIPYQPKPATLASSASTVRNKRHQDVPKHKKASNTADSWARMVTNFDLPAPTDRSYKIKELVQTITYRKPNESLAGSMVTPYDTKGLSGMLSLPVDIMATIMGTMDPHVFLKFVNNSNVARAIFEASPRSFVVSLLRSVTFPIRQLALGFMLVRQTQAKQGIEVWKLKPQIWNKLLVGFSDSEINPVDKALWTSLELRELNDSEHIRNVSLPRYVSTYLGANKSSEAALAMIDEIASTLPMVVSFRSPYYTRHVFGPKEIAVPAYEVPGGTPIGYDEMKRQEEEVARLLKAGLSTVWETE